MTPETVSSYRYFQSSWQNRIVYQMGCGLTISCPDPATHMLCVLGQVIYSFLIWTADNCYMGSLNILLVINIESLFTFMANLGYFPVAMFIWNNFSTYLLGSERIFVCQIMIIPLIKINQNDLGKWAVSRPFPSSTCDYNFIIHIWSLSWFMV